MAASLMYDRTALAESSDCRQVVPWNSIWCVRDSFYFPQVRSSISVISQIYPAFRKEDKITVNPVATGEPYTVLPYFSIPFDVFGHFLCNYVLDIYLKIDCPKKENLSILFL